MPTFPKYDISDDFAAHKRRGSSEPGIDFKTPYGTPVPAPQSGRVTIAYRGTAGGAGRRVTIAGNGATWDLIHLSRVDVSVGQWVNEGQTVGLSGASGFGRDWYYGPHVHISYWPRQYNGAPPWASAVDFMRLVRPPVTPAKLVIKKEDDMDILSIGGRPGVRHGGDYMVVGKDAARLGPPGSVAIEGGKVVLKSEEAWEAARRFLNFIGRV